MDYMKWFQPMIDTARKIEEGRKRAGYFRRRPWEIPNADTRHPGSKRPAHIVKAERRRKNKAAKQARKLNWRNA